MELDHAPFAPFMSPRMATPPGMTPLKPKDWLHRDAAYAAQMAYRDRLVETRRDIVFACEPRADRAAAELLAAVVECNLAYGDFSVAGGVATRPDGVAVGLDSDHPLVVAGRLGQEDFCLLQKPDGAGEHVLTGAILCFPSRWSLAQKMGRPLTGVHAPVPGYEADLASRVQRLFDGLRPGRPLVRANWLAHPSPELFQPLTEEVKLAEDSALSGRFWLRVERQALVKLDSAVAFSIKTCVTPFEALSPEQRDGLIAALEASSREMRVYHGGLARHEAALAVLRGLQGARGTSAQGASPGGVSP